MATLPAGGAAGAAGFNEDTLAVVSLAAAQAGNGPSTNVVDRGTALDPVALQITTAVGATPTCTYLVEGSLDNVNWLPISNADAAAPQTLIVATFTITTAGVNRRIIPRDTPSRYIRVTFSANTNVTNTVDAYVYGPDVTR
jgi:hypothetical protein